MNPPFPFAILIVLAALLLALATIGSWRSTAGLSPRARAVLLGMRWAAVAALLVLLFNPGKWVRPTDEQSQPWLVLYDVSASMTQPLAAGQTRAAEAAAAVAGVARAAGDAGLPLRVHPFDGALQAAVEPGALPAPAGAQSHIVPAISQALQDGAAAGEVPAGIIVISDGRQTLTSPQAELDALALRARSRKVPIHTVVIGNDGPQPDLLLVQPRASLTAFAAQPLRIPFALKSTELPPVRPIVTLRDASGAELATLTLDLPAGKTVTAAFEVNAPAASAQWTLETPALDGEVRPANNKSALNIRILESKTRVFIAEGAPYWDSKFLAQLLRQQPQMDVQSVHRLSNERYFRIDSGSSVNAETDHPVFPANLDELARFDLVVFGKNIDPFLTAERAEALRAFVRDRGGAVLFARGKPTTTELPALEALEPVVWGSTTSSDFRFAPTRDGEAAGLFGQALPGPDASLWAALPHLKDGRQIATVKPFARVLAEGIPDGARSQTGQFPALVARRYGLGVTGLVNGDGLWKWDFFPEARELGNCYEDFWIQLIQWLAAYSEFLPGQDFSLRLPSSQGETGSAMTAQISYRGPLPVPQPILQVTPPAGGEVKRIQPATLADPSGRPTWRASFTPDRPGIWRLQVIDPRDPAPPAPEVLVNVPAPPRETDDLSPDPAFLQAIATLTGGQTIETADFPAFLREHVVKSPPVSRESGAVWQPAWNHPFYAMAIAALFAGEWFMRRRRGLT